MDPIGCASRSLQGDIRATEPGLQAGGSFPPPSEKAASFFHQYRDVVLVEVGAEGLPVARFQRLSEGAVFPEQGHAAV